MEKQKYKYTALHLKVIITFKSSFLISDGGNNLECIPDATVWLTVPNKRERPSDIKVVMIEVKKKQIEPL